MASESARAAPKEEVPFPPAVWTALGVLSVLVYLAASGLVANFVRQAVAERRALVASGRPPEADEPEDTPCAPSDHHHHE